MFLICRGKLAKIGFPVSLSVWGGLYNSLDNYLDDYVVHKWIEIGISPDFREVSFPIRFFLVGDAKGHIYF